MRKVILFLVNAVLALVGPFSFAGTNAEIHSESEIPRTFYFDPDLRFISRELKTFSEKEGVSFWVYDFRKHRLLTACGLDEFQKPQPMGSILKPFVALAAWAGGPDAGPSSERSERPGVDLEHHGVVCPPSEKSVPVSEACWNRRGHGPQTFIPALALSCNYFFASLAEGMNEQAWSNTFQLFRMEAPVFRSNLSLENKRALAIGSDPDFLVSPSRLFFAYLALFGEDFQEFHFKDESMSLWLRRENLTNEIPQKRIKTILAALDLTQKIGTVKNQKHFYIPASVKTGTSYAMEDGDVDPVRTCGWAFAALPQGSARFAILLRKNHSTGAQGAYPEIVKLLEAFYKKF